MAFENAMKAMGGKKAPDEDKGKQKPAEHGNVEGEDGESQHVGHHLMQQAHEKEPHGTHMHIHHDGYEHVSHHVGEDGQVQGPHHHPDHEALKAHMDGVFGGGEQHEQPQEEPSLGGYGG